MDRMVGPIGAGRPQGSGDAAPEDDTLKLTYVSYFTRMNGYQKKNLAIFYTNVRVLHMPAEDPRIEIDIDRLLEKDLPPGAMYLRCDQLKVFSRPRADGKSLQEMEARGRVSISSREFSGMADFVSYNEAKDQVIFDGGDGGVATLYKVKRPGERPQKIEGRKIIYSRRTGDHTGTGIRTITGQ